MCFVDAVSAACSISNCLGSLVTANETTITVIRRNGSYFAFDSHTRNHLGVPDTNDTAVLLQLTTTHHQFWLSTSLIAVQSSLAQRHRHGAISRWSWQMLHCARARPNMWLHTPEY